MEQVISEGFGGLVLLSSSDFGHSYCRSDHQWRGTQRISGRLWNQEPSFGPGFGRTGTAGYQLIIVVKLGSTE